MSRYQTIYNIGLLDDLHNYFPEILYNRGRFQTVPQLLEYVHTQIQSQVNPFTRGYTAYESERTAQNLDSMFHRAQNVATTLQTPPRVQVQAQQVPGAPRRAPRRATAEVVTETFDLSSLLNMTTVPPVIASPINTGFRHQAQDLGVLGSLLNILEGFPRVPNPTAAAEAFASVVVRPTQEQIDAASALRGATTEDENEACAVCQENYTEGQAIRTLNHCSHSFHRNCIDPWFERNVHCPVCRHDIREVTE